MEAALAAHKKDTDVRMQQQQSAQEDKEKWHTATSTDQQARLEKMEGMLAKIMSHMERTTVATQPTQRRASTASAAEPSQKKQKKSSTTERKGKKKEPSNDSSEAEMECDKRGRPRRAPIVDSDAQSIAGNSNAKRIGASRRTRTRSAN